MAEKRHCDSSDTSTLRQDVFRLLDQNPTLTAKFLAKLLKLPYRQHAGYFRNLRYAWRCHHENERGSKCSNHGWRGWCVLPGVVAGIRTGAVEVGWLRSRARNRWLLWRDRVGRLQWFETGRVNVYVRRPANLGKAYQLICNAFSFTGLITDIKILEQVLSSVRFKGAHYVFPVGQRLPKLTIDLFQKSNGIVIKVGDITHPDAVEVLATYPDWAEKNERLFEEVIKTLRKCMSPSNGNCGVPESILRREPVGVS